MNYKIQPWQHQLDVIERTKNRKFFALLWEMGCGKTCALVNILRFLYLRHNSTILPTLILCPGIVCRNWEREIGMHAGGLMRDSVCVLDADSTDGRLEQIRDGRILSKQIFIVPISALRTPDSWQRLIKEIGQPQVLVVDESHRCKNPSTHTAKHVLTVSASAKYKYILSGTPVLQSPLDLWSQFRILSPQIFPGSYHSFKKKYFQDKNERWRGKQNYFPKWELYPDAEEKIGAIIAEHSSRIEISDCLSLPPLIRQTILIEPTPEQKRIYDEMASTYVADVGDPAGGQMVAELAIEKSLRLQQICSGILTLDTGHTWTTETEKIPALIEILTDIAPAKAVVWCHWKGLHPLIEEALIKNGIPYVVITGDQNAREKEKAERTFTSNPDYRVCLATQGAAGTGTNLQVANYSITLAKTYNLELHLQSGGRTYRGGSEVHERVVHIDLVTKDTIEEDITEALAGKMNSADLVYRMVRRISGKSPVQEAA